MKNIVEIIARSLVDYPEQVIVEEKQDGSHLVLQLHVAPEDMGKVIGKQGRIAKAMRDEKYKLTDPFCLFYLKFVKNAESINEEMWSSNVTSPRITAWRGFAFENVCFNHISAIKRTLGISGVSTRHSAWTKNDEEDGLQIDLIIERNDNIVNMCEIKFGKRYDDDDMIILKERDFAN